MERCLGCVRDRAGGCANSLAPGAPGRGAGEASEGLVPPTLVSGAHQTNQGYG